MNKSIIHKPTPRGNGKGPHFCRFFRHWRSGKLMDAWKYGYRCWPLGRSRR